MERDKEEEGREIIKGIETYSEAYFALCDAGNSEIESDYILKDFWE